MSFKCRERRDGRNKSSKEREEESVRRMENLECREGL